MRDLASVRGLVIDWLGNMRGLHLPFFPVATDGTMCSGVDSASKNEYQGFLLG